MPRGSLPGSRRSRRAHGKQDARRLLTERLAATGLTHEELPQLAGCESRKVAIAQVLLEQTTVGMKWLAVHLHLRSAANASQQIRRQRQTPPRFAPPKQWITQSRNVA